MLLLDNIIFDLQKNGGVSNVWKAVLRELNKSGLEFFCIKSKYESQSPYLKNTKFYVKDKSLPVIVKRYLDCTVNNVSVFHSSYFRVHKDDSVINVLTIHDFIYEQYSSGFGKWIHLRQKLHALKKADAIICVSENTKSDLFRFHPWVNKNIVSVIYNGVDKNIFYPLQTKSFRSFLLYVGGRGAHKNFDFVLKLMTSKELSSIKLVVVGGAKFSKDEMEFISKNDLKDKITHKQNIDDAELNNIYNEALALIYPSYYEGFGIPPLEAMSAGCPVICSGTSSLPEVVGDAGLFVDINNFASALPHIKDLTDPIKRQAIVAKGLIQASKFSWKKTACQTIALYKCLLHKV